MVDHLVNAFGLGVGTLFLWTATAKALRPADSIRSLNALGFSRQASTGLAKLAIVLEAAVPFAILMGLYPLGAALTATLGTAFAATATWAIVHHLKVSCACFGASSSSQYLGRRQLMALPVWLAGSIGVYSLPTAPLNTRLDVAITVVAVLALFQALACGQQYRAARADRWAYAQEGLLR